jgi:prevent-host-death family protein
MKTYTYSEARQKLAALLDRARREGRVQIRRRDGQLFVLQPARPEGSPLDVPGVPGKRRRGEAQEWLRESREGAASRALRTEPSNDPASSPPKSTGRVRKKSAPRRRRT